jgi:hypothetical protein
MLCVCPMTCSAKRTCGAQRVLAARWATDRQISIQRFYGSGAEARTLPKERSTRTCAAPSGTYTRCIPAISTRISRRMRSGINATLRERIGELRERIQANLTEGRRHWSELDKYLQDDTWRLAEWFMQNDRSGAKARKSRIERLKREQRGKSDSNEDPHALERCRVCVREKFGAFEAAALRYDRNKAQRQLSKEEKDFWESFVTEEDPWSPARKEIAKTSERSTDIPRQGAGASDCGTHRCRQIH